MRCPTVAELPPRPPGKSSWPWTVETKPLPSARPDGSPWPRISIVTPSYNQGQFVEETIRSVLLQGYPDLEYIIIDGGSTDQSVEIIKKYQPWLTYWVSEKDRGQAHAINKGFSRAAGKIGAYLNSDDFYLPGALPYSAKSFSRVGWDLLIGRSDVRYFPSWRYLRRSWWLHRVRVLPLPFLAGYGLYGISQESTFWNLQKLGSTGFDENLHFCLDADWYLRVARGSTIALSSRRIGHSRSHENSKTATLQSLFISESRDIGLKNKHQKIDHYMCVKIYRTYNKQLVVNLLITLLSGHAEFVYLHPT
jgi:glycosyltransferase involved in cell wall biosynthesis